MNKLIAVLIAGAFMLAPVAAMAQGSTKAFPEKTPPIPVNEPALKEEALMKRADYANLSPAEKAAYKKGMAAQRQMYEHTQDAQAPNNPTITPEQQKAINAQKGTPKALPDAKAKQDALQQQEKAAAKGGGGN